MYQPEVKVIGPGAVLRVFQRLFLLITIGSLFVFIPMSLEGRATGPSIGQLVEQAEVATPEGAEARMDGFDLWLNLSGLGRGQGDNP